MEKKRILLLWWIVFWLNALDIRFTLYGLNLGVITEKNPIMNFFIEKGAIQTIAFKYIGVFCLLAIIILTVDKIPHLRESMWAVICILTIIVSMHFYWMILLII